MGGTSSLINKLLHDALLPLHLLPYTQHNIHALCRNPSIKQSVEELKQTTESLRERQAILIVLPRNARHCFVVPENHTLSLQSRIIQ